MLCCDILELILSFIFFGVCLTSFIWRLTKDNKDNFFMEFEMWSLLMQLVYYVLFFLIGIISIFQKATDNRAQRFFKNVVFKYLFPFVVNSAAAFYLGYYFRWFSFDTRLKDNDFWLSFFIHGISQACFVVDLILFSRDYVDTQFFDFLVISGIYAAYAVILFISQPTIHGYAFLDKSVLDPKDNMFILSLMIVLYFVYLYLYFIFMCVVKFKSGISNLFGGNKKVNKDIPPPEPEETKVRESKESDKNKLVPMDDEDDNENNEKRESIINSENNENNENNENSINNASNENSINNETNERED